MPVATPTTAHSYAYQSLRAQILDGALVPGTPLIQATLARELGVSMTPIREALRDLATEGLVSLSPHRGATVTVLDMADAQEIHRIRLALEPEACAVACELISDEMLERAEEIFDSLSEASAGEWVALNRDFHIHLVSANPSARLRHILSSLLEAAALYVGVAMTHRRGPSPQEEHREILDAFHRRDPAAVATAVADHIRSSITSLDFQEPAGEA
jgi:DNA-binding GntR family transcriptional regulator